MKRLIFAIVMLAALVCATVYAGGRLETHNGMVVNGPIFVGKGQCSTVTGAGLCSAGPVEFNSTVQFDGALTLSSPMTPANGGTGLATYTIGDLVYASGATTLSKLIDAATGNALISGGAGVAPSYGKIGLTTHVSGTLPVANGGTNSTTALSGSAIMVSNGTAIVQGDAGTTTTLLHGNAAGAPTYGAVALGTDVSGALPLANFTDGTTGQVLRAGDALGDPAWASLDLTADVGVSVLPVENGGTGAATLALNGVLFGNATSAVGATVAGTDPQILGNVAGVPTFLTLSSDASIDNTGAVTVSNAGTADALTGNPADCGANEFCNGTGADGACLCAALGDADIPDGITVTLAGTATALASDPSDCGANAFATTIAASGNLTCATPALGTDTSGNFVAGVACGDVLSGCVADSEGSAPTIGVADGAITADKLQTAPTNIAGDQTIDLSTSNATCGGGADPCVTNLTLDGELTVPVVTVTDGLDVQTTNTSGTALGINFAALTTQTAFLRGGYVDMTNVTPDGVNAVYGLHIEAPAANNASLVRGLYIQGTDYDDALYVDGTASIGQLATLNGNVDIKNGATTSGVLSIYEDSTDGTNFASFQVPALAANTVYTLPADDGDAGEQLQTNGSGALTWEAAGGGGCTPYSLTFNPDETGANDDFVALVKIATATGDAYTSTAEANADDFRAPAALTVSDLRVVVADAPGIGQDFWRVMFRDDGADTTLTCNITDNATTCEDVANDVAVVALSRLNLQVASNNNANADPLATSEMTISFCVQ